jgi:hypothetical protein
LRDFRDDAAIAHDADGKKSTLKAIFGAEPEEM